MSDETARPEPFAFSVHARDSNGQLISACGVVGASPDDLESGSKNRANLVGLFRLLHAHVVKQGVAGTESSIASSADCPRSVLELVSVATTDDTVLHALIHALMGGHADEPLVSPCRR
jgi:hypothetical protein